MGGPTHRWAATGFEAAPSGLGPRVPPLEQRPPQIEYAPPQRTAIGAPLLIPSLSYDPRLTHPNTDMYVPVYSDPMCVAVCMLTPKHLYPLGFFNPKDHTQSRDW